MSVLLVAAGVPEPARTIDGQEVGFAVLSIAGGSESAAQAVAARYAPGSTTYGAFMSPRSFGSRHGPSTGQVRAPRQELGRYGLTSSWHPGNHWMVVEGPVLAVDWLEANAATELEGSAAVGMADGELVVTTDLVPAGGLSPTDIARAYNVTPLHESGIDGSGETIVVVVPGDGYRQESLDTFTDEYGLPRIEVVDGWDDSSAIEPIGELEMDLQVIRAIAPGARIVVYASQDGRFGPMLRMLDAMVAEQPGAVVSQSFSNCETAWGLILARQVEDLYRRSALSGQTVFSSSGDNGAFGCLTQDGIPDDAAVGVRLPASASYVTAVRGTYLSIGADGSYRDEAAWNGPALTEGSGGGVSLYYPLPDWQANLRATDGNGQRQVRDVAADAGSGMRIHLTGHGWVAGGGTSQATPIWAGVAALVNQYLKREGLPPLGFANPALYRVAETDPAVFHDVTLGTNLRYPAVTGYDMATGLGTPDVLALAQALAEYQRSASRNSLAGGDEP